MSVACANSAVHGKRTPAHHDSVAQVRLCFARQYGLPSHEEVIADVEQAFAEEQMHEEQLAEIEAERRNERFFEERGFDDGFEEWEASRGVM